MRAGVLLLLLLAAPAAAAPPTVDDGVAAFEFGEYEKARDILADIVAANTAPPEKEPAARLYLAAAHHALGDVTRAYQHLLEFRRLFPDHPVNPRLFLPDFVTLAAKAQAEVKAELAAKAPPPPPPPEEGPPPPPEVVSPTPPEAPALAGVTARVGLTGFADVAGGAVGAAPLVSLSFGPLEGGLRVLLGQAPGLQVEVGARFLPSAPVQPRAGLRFTALPLLEGGAGLGGGVYAGIRAPLGGGFALLADAGAEALLAPEGYRPFAVLVHAGVEWAFLGGGR